MLIRQSCVSSKVAKCSAAVVLIIHFFVADLAIHIQRPSALTLLLKELQSLWWERGLAAAEESKGSDFKCYSYMHRTNLSTGWAYHEIWISA